MEKVEHYKAKYQEQFTSNSNLNEKSRKSRNQKNNYKIWQYWNRKTKIHQHKRLIPIKNIDINKIFINYLLN